MAKFAMLFQTLQNSFSASAFQFFEPELPQPDWLELVHDPNFIHDYCYGTLDPSAIRRIGLPWSEGLVKRTLTAIGGTILTAQLALQQGIALNTAGGTHHAYPAFGSGFCIFNDVAIAIRLLQREQLIQRALILDLDVHQGDGTAFIFSNDSTVFTCSIHCEKNFPHRKQRSDRDLALPEGTEDHTYLAALENLLPEIFEQSKPDLVFYNAGVDPHVSDLLGKMNLSDRGIFQRDQRVLAQCQAYQVPIACVIGGGYARDLQALVNRHRLLFQAAHELFKLNSRPYSQFTQSWS